MKKFAIIAASLICFAGCARNDDTGIVATDSSLTNTTAVGTPGATESGVDTSSSTTTPSPGLDPTGSSMSLTNTNTLSSTNILNDTNTNSLNALPPGAGGQSATESGAQSSSPDSQNNSASPQSNSDASQSNQQQQPPQ